MTWNELKRDKDHRARCEEAEQRESAHESAHGLAEAVNSDENAKVVNKQDVLGFYERTEEILAKPDRYDHQIPKAKEIDTNDRRCSNRFGWWRRRDFRRQYSRKRYHTIQT